MPGKVKVKILAGRNLPVMDKSSDTSDAYVEVKLGNTTFKTDVYRKSLNPMWNSEWFKFEVDDEELQDEPLQVRIMDYDMYSANDAIGKVYIDLNPLVLPQNTGSTMAGWIPIFDTMHGIRGEVNITVKVDLFSDFNRFRQSSCGVQFFCTPGVPQGYRAHIVHGFVEELVVNDDPEYQWIDKIRTPRASNEARQTLFSKLSGEVQRKIGLKALELGGNAVLGYRQCFDLEGESGIVVRGIGTAVTLVRHQLEAMQQGSPSPTKDSSRESFTLDSAYPYISEPIPQMRLFSQNPYYPSLARSPNGRLVNPVIFPPVVESKIRFTRSRYHSIAVALPTSLATNSRSSRHPLLGSSTTSKHLNHLRPRSQSTSSAVQDEQSLALQQYISEHQHDAEAPPSPSSSLPDDPESPCFPISIAIPPMPSITVHNGHISEPTSPRDSLPCPCCSPLPGEFPGGPAAPVSRSPLCHRRSPIPEDGLNPGSPITRTPFKLSQSPIKQSVPCVCRRSSDSELNVTAKGTPCSAGGTNGSSSRPRQAVQPDTMEMLEYPFLSMTQFPLGFIVHLGGVVSAHSVKLLGRINNPDEPETRDAWWTEIRMEIRSHARALGCNVVLGYSESTSICDDICILSASGTAAIVCMYHAEADACRREASVPNASDKLPTERDRGTVRSDCFLSTGNSKSPAEGGDKEDVGSGIGGLCSICHIPYSESSIPFPVTLAKCAICRKAKVPDILFATIAPPAGIPITGRGCLIQARVCRVKKDSKNEMNAKEISDSLPFLEYELHRQLLNKLKVKGMNGLFGLRVQVSVGAKMLVAVATATAVFLTPLSPPLLPRISSGKVSDGGKLNEIQRLITDTVVKNQEFYNLHVQPQVIQEIEPSSSNDDSDDELSELDLSCGNKDTCILEIDDAEDADIISLLIDPRSPVGFEIVNLSSVPGVDNIVRNLQMFTRVCRARIPAGTVSCRQLSQYFENIAQSLYFKLRKMTPCALCNLQYIVELPEDEELQVTVLGMAVGLGDPAAGSRSATTGESSPVKPSDSDLIFNMEEEQPPQSVLHTSVSLPKLKTRYRVPEKKFNYHTAVKERFGIDITPLPYIPGAPIERYLGNLNFFFIRESTSIRENGGLSGFMQGFIAEVLAIVRAHVAALGGNAMVSYFMSQCVLLHNPHKNQGQCLINVGGDVVQAYNPLNLFLPRLPLNDATANVPCRVQVRGSPKEAKTLTSLIGSQERAMAPAADTCRSCSKD